VTTNTDITPTTATTTPTDQRAATATTTCATAHGKGRATNSDRVRPEMMVVAVMAVMMVCLHPPCLQRPLSEPRLHVAKGRKGRQRTWVEDTAAAIVVVVEVVVEVKARVKPILPQSHLVYMYRH
jgi:hypothetical protein